MRRNSTSSGTTSAASIPTIAIASRRGSGPIRISAAGSIAASPRYSETPVVGYGMSENQREVERSRTPATGAETPHNRRSTPARTPRRVPRLQLRNRPPVEHAPQKNDGCEIEESGCADGHGSVVGAQPGDATNDPGIAGEPARVSAPSRPRSPCRLDRARPECLPDAGHVEVLEHVEVEPGRNSSTGIGRSDRDR